MWRVATRRSSRSRRLALTIASSSLPSPSVVPLFAQGAEGGLFVGGDVQRDGLTLAMARLLLDLGGKG
jgi:hypothetical protein